MVEWMENVEKSISRIMADKVYTSAEFKRERDNFHVSATTSIKKGVLKMRYILRLCAKILSAQRSKSGFNTFWRS